MQMAGMRTNWPLKQWQLHLANLYNEQNNARKPLENLSRLVEMSSGLARGVREQDIAVLEMFAPRVLAWLLGIANQLDIDLESAIWNSYPGVCTHCHVGDHCVCRLTPACRSRLRDPEEITHFQSLTSMPLNLVDWQAMFRTIYSNVNQMLGTERCVLHFLEELGEVSEAIRFYIAPDSPFDKPTAKLMISDELSDLFAWFCGITNNMRVEVDHFMKNIYVPKCLECSANPCICDPYHIHLKVRFGGK